MDVTVEVGPEGGFSGESGAAKIKERLQKRNQARIEDAERRKEEKESRYVAEEKDKYFSETFNRERVCIEELLSDCSGADRAVVTQRLEEATAKTAQLQKFLNDSVLFLTQYELRQSHTLHLKHIDSCEILCGPVSSSVFVDQCKNSTLVFPCQQLRTHNTTDTQVYLHVTSRAIIEDCQGVSFAPFSWSYPTLEEDFSVSGLDRDRNNWNQVDDFNWLAAGTPSPNWTVIPEADRKTNWGP
ncbi:hypothetical protein INR49_027279 [Caranx melampygus]|nr:hypothetical protein INR49_027279 [Caranx melampygus]